jgi:hypothetical protein
MASTSEESDTPTPPIDLEKSTTSHDVSQTFTEPGLAVIQPSKLNWLLTCIGLFLGALLYGTNLPVNLNCYSYSLQYPAIFQASTPQLLQLYKPLSTKISVIYKNCLGLALVFPLALLLLFFYSVNSSGLLRSNGSILALSLFSRLVVPSVERLLTRMLLFLDVLLRV